MSAKSLPSELCGEGRQILASLQQHNQAIAQSKDRVAECHLGKDSADRQVPRSLYDALRSQTSQRAMSQMQWDRHRSACPRCESETVRMQMAA